MISRDRDDILVARGEVCVEADIPASRRTLEQRDEMRIWVREKIGIERIVGGFFGHGPIQLLYGVIRNFHFQSPIPTLL